MNPASVWKRALNPFAARQSAANARKAGLLGDGLRPQLADLVALRREAKGLHRQSRKRQMTTSVGGVTSTHRGRGIDFEEVRVYQPGDDIRTMDWRVTARTGEPHTKVFRDERERPVSFCVKQASSMQFGSRVCFKSVVAARAAALLAWTCVEQGDRIGGIVFSDDRRIELPWRTRRDGALSLCHALCSVHDVTSADPPVHGLAVERLSRMTTTGQLVVIVSDFYELDEDYETLLKRIAQRTELVMIMVYDGIEKNLPDTGQYPICSGTDIVTLDLSTKAALDDYRSVYSRRAERALKLCNSMGTTFLELSSQDNLVSTLRDGLNPS